MRRETSQFFKRVSPRERIILTYLFFRSLLGLQVWRAFWVESPAVGSLSPRPQGRLGSLV